MLGEEAGLDMLVTMKGCLTKNTPFVNTHVSNLIKDFITLSHCRFQFFNEEGIDGGGIGRESSVRAESTLESFELKD